jgi:A/G-specific adenine glycosylase
MTNQEFTKRVWSYYNSHKRDLLWRHINSLGEINPYHVLVSEVMLQQTQVSRVMPKFEQWINKFPDFNRLAGTNLGNVLKEWDGLGYNRRAKYLHESAKAIVLGGGEIPRTVDELQKLPGIGPNTAAAILVYSFNEPHIFIETNIRTVYIYHYFKNEVKISDIRIKEKLEQTLDTKNPREWYWALMDYGTFLKKDVGNVAIQSNKYVSQSVFKGSKRELRAKVIKLLLVRAQTKKQIISKLNDYRIENVIEELIKERLIANTDGYYHLP